MMKLFRIMFPTQEKIEKQRIQNAVNLSKSYIYIHDDDAGYPAVFINDTPVFHVNDMKTCLNDLSININDVQPFISSIRNMYVEQHKNDRIIIK